MAVLLVVLYHADVPGVTGGYVGVDVFFVISGFLITAALVAEAEREGRIALARFYGRRMRRLLPAAVIVMVFTVLLARVALPVSQVQSLVRDTFFAAVYGINYHLAAEGVEYQNATAPPSALQHFWSLSVEEQFYVFWPLLIVLALVLGRQRRFRTVMVVAISVVSAGTLLASVLQTPENTSLAYFSIHTRAWELGAGALLALTAHRLALPDRARVLLAWGGMAAIVATAFLYTERTLYPGWAAIVPVAGAVALLAAGTGGTVPSMQRFLGHGAMQYMGKVSYAWYLWHWPLLVLLPAWVGYELGWGYRVEIVFLAFWAAVLTYFVEDAAARHSLTLRGWLAAGSGMSAVAVLTALGILVTLPNVVGTGVARQDVFATDVTSVQQELRASLSLAAVPRNLDPELTRISDDYPATTAAGCHLDLRDVRQGTCLFGDPEGAEVMVLVGDSHAEQWFPALDAEARANGYQLYSLTKSACPIASIGTVYSNDLKREYSECDTWRSELGERVRSLDADVLVSSQADAVPWDTVSDTEWARGTVSALRDMAGPDTSVVYLGDTPAAQADPETCLQENVERAAACAFDESGSFPFPERRGAVQASVTSAGWTYVDTLPFFCRESSGECPMVVNNIVQPRDSTGHMTATYSAWLAPVLAPLFQEQS